MRVFVTGGTGFIGKPTLNELMKRGHKLLVLSRRNKKLDHNPHLLKGDLSNTHNLLGSLKKFAPEAAVHLAWEGIPDFSYTQSLKNLEEGLAIFNSLKEVGCKKIVVTGTGFDCGNRVGKIPDEIEVKPKNAFVAAKHSLHIMGEELSRENKLDFIWLRPFNPYGDGQRAGSVIPFIMRSVVDKIPLKLRNPLAQGDFIHVEDVASLIASAVSRGRGIKTYNVGSGYLTPVREIARLICRSMGASDAYYTDFKKSSKGKLLEAPYADIKKAKKELGWHPKVDIETGIKKTITAYENNCNRV